MNDILNTATLNKYSYLFTLSLFTSYFLFLYFILQFYRVYWTCLLYGNCCCFSPLFFTVVIIFCLSKTEFWKSDHLFCFRMKSDRERQEKLAKERLLARRNRRNQTQNEEEMVDLEETDNINKLQVRFEGSTLIIFQS